MLKHNKLPIVILTLLFLLIFSSTSYAHEGADDEHEHLQNGQVVRDRIQENLQERREDLKENLCDHATASVSNKIIGFNAHKQDQSIRYARLVFRLEEIAVSLSEKGYDTTDLEGKTEIFADMIAAYLLSYDDFVIELGESVGLACVDSNDAFRDALSSIKDSWNDLQQMRRDIRSYYSTEIRGAIKDLREQARSNSISEEEVNNE